MDAALQEGVRVCEDNAEVCVWGTIMSIDEDANTCWVQWDNGCDMFNVDADCLVPEGGW